ncbi:hypothetical protein [Spirosoma pollinicola]|uniref:Uncharacterized protein n=1 Tax=Spirosoma pollinicola TaxID=2057025 RepID=A0A2K8Z518_9BACT|nr:hypothetical protein [Spirosoma pollinicola]AUD04973.1 hypothetical protein CWM47_25860 [Spirosoma pollinicola]
MILDQLDKEENNLLSQINNIAGSIEEKVRQSEIKGIVDAYKSIHARYAELAKKNSEALKRGLFLQWYVLVEPSYLSGISDIDTRLEKVIIDALDDNIGQNKIDPELYAMVSYYSDLEFVFDRFEDCVNLQKFLESRLDYGTIIRQVEQSDLNHRGQMGIYWQSIISLD